MNTKSHTAYFGDAQWLNLQQTASCAGYVSGLYTPFEYLETRFTTKFPKQLAYMEIFNSLFSINMLLLRYE